MVYYCVTTKIDDKGRIWANITDSVEADARPENTFKSTQRADFYADWFDSREDAEEFVKQSENA